MNLLPIKLLGALAVAGLVAVGGNAFTASGVNRGTVAASQVVGVGTVDQTVTNATLDTVNYVTDGSNVTSVEVTFAAPLQSGATVKLAAYAGGSSTPATGDEELAASGTPPEYVFTLADDGLPNLSKISITVT